MSSLFLVLILLSTLFSYPQPSPTGLSIIGAFIESSQPSTIMTTRQKSTEEAIISLQEITTSLQKTSENHATILQTLTANFETTNITLQNIQKALNELIHQVNRSQKKSSDEIESNTPLTDSPKTSVKLDISDPPEILPLVLSVNSSGIAVCQTSPAAFVADAEKLITEPSNSEYESEFDKDDEIRLSEPLENAVYNREDLLDKLRDISWPKNVEWMRKLSFDVNQEPDVNDDLTREHVFYTQALEGTKDAFLKLKPGGSFYLLT